MNKLRKFFGLTLAVAIAAAIAISMVACPTDGDDNPTPTSTPEPSTSPSPSPTTGPSPSPSTSPSPSPSPTPAIEITSVGNIRILERGNSLQFNAQLLGGLTGTPTWSIAESGKHANTTINSSSGLLTVNAAETQNTLTIQAAIGDVKDTFSLTLTTFKLEDLFGVWNYEAGADVGGKDPMKIAQTKIWLEWYDFEKFADGGDWAPITGSGTLWGGTNYTKGYKVVGMEFWDGEWVSNVVHIYWMADGGDGKARIAVSIGGDPDDPEQEDWVAETVISDYEKWAKFVYSGPWEDD